MTNPYTIVDAINQVTETVTPHPWGFAAPPSLVYTSPDGTTNGTLTPDTTSLYARAEQFLDRARVQILSRGWPENTEKSRVFTAGNFKVDLTGYLNVKSSGPDGYRSIVLRYDSAAAAMSAYDADVGTFNVAATSAGLVYLDVVVDLAWVNLPVKLADLIINHAKMLFNRRVGGNEQLNDQQLGQELGFADSSVDRNSAMKTGLPFNSREEMVAMQAQPPSRG